MSRFLYRYKVTQINSLVLTSFMMHASSRSQEASRVVPLLLAQSHMTMAHCNIESARPLRTSCIGTTCPT